MEKFNKESLKSKRDINLIVIHCSATREGQDVKTETIKGWHVNERKWSDIGYHFVIELDGSIKIGRDINRTGSHAKGFNTGSIGICYVGGCTKDMKPKDTKTSEQNASLAALLIHIYDIYGKVDVLGHCDLPRVKKACPSFNVFEFVKNVESYLFQ